MEAGYVILNLKPGAKKDFIAKVKNVKAAKEVKIVIGIFDAVVKIEAETIEDLQKVYLNQIDEIEGIINSRLHIVACPRTRK